MTESAVQGVVQKADIISYGTLAEISHFQTERVQDYKEMMQVYLRGQIEFYRTVKPFCIFSKIRIQSCIKISMYMFNHLCANPPIRST